MKRTCTTLSFLLVILGVQAQMPDSVSLGAGATRMCFYQLSTGTKTVADNTDWHLAISVRPAIIPNSTNRAVSIRMNGSIGVKLYHAAKKDTASFATLDTTGYRNWPQFFDGDTSWNLGAFNSTKNFSDDFNYGWGQYQFAGGIHSVIGDSMFLMELPGGKLKKISILSDWKDTAIYFQFADLDNSNFKLQKISKNRYGTKNFVYYNLETQTILDKEPANGAWDLVFLPYTNNSDYNVQRNMGVLQNEDVLAAMVTGADAQLTYYAGIYSKEINTIGKAFRDVISDTVFTDRAYFVRDRSGNQYKVVFTGFGGATNGNYYFTKQLTAPAGISNAAAVRAAVYPNPFSNTISVVMDEHTEQAELVLWNTAGVMMHREMIGAIGGGEVHTIEMPALAAGSYVLQLVWPGGNVRWPMLKQ
ncbi:MAG: hypothetical protein U0T84_04685 [Chitinophagales bacterium]